MPRCKGTKGYSDPDGGHSKKEAKRFLAAFHDNRVIRELGMDVMRSISLFCIRHQATDTLHRLVVHAAKGAPALRGSRLAPGEAGWPIHWTRPAPCAIKLRLDQVALTKQDIALQLTGRHAITSLSLQGCAMATEDLQLICAALKSNMAMVELRPSENLIAPGEEEAKRFQSHPMRTSHVIVNGEGEIVA